MYHVYNGLPGEAAYWLARSGFFPNTQVMDGAVR